MRIAKLAVITLLVGCRPPGGNLLTNGSFEDGPDPGQWHAAEVGATTIKGWTVTRAQIDYIGPYWTAADGKRSLDLHGSPGFGGVSQTFKTDKGKKYKVTFALGGNPMGSVPKKTLAVSVGSQSKEFSFDTSGKSQRAMGWQNVTWEFTAESDRSTLELRSTMKEDLNCGPSVDNVSVVAVKN
jgi:choice-of-anchor C domain-containing protein